MAITFTNLGSSAAPDITTGVNANSYDTASWTPPTSGLILLFVTTKEPNGVNAVTVSGNGITWVNLGSVVFDTLNRGRITLFGANASGSSTGVTTIDFNGTDQNRISASFFLAEGVDLSGGVADAIVQLQSNSGTSGTGSVTLAAAGHADNRPIAAFAHDGANEATTPRANWTEMDDLPGASPNVGFHSQVREDAFETTASATWATTAEDWGGLAAELKAEQAGGGGNVTLEADQGSFSLSGQASTLDISMPVEHGSFS